MHTSANVYINMSISISVCLYLSIYLYTVYMYICIFLKAYKVVVYCIFYLICSMEGFCVIIFWGSSSSFFSVPPLACVMISLTKS